MKTKKFEELAAISIESYSKNAKTYSNLWEWSDGAMDKVIIDILNPFRELMHADDLVLVAGCGTGRDTQYLSSHGLRCVGIDLAEGMLQEALYRGVSAPLIYMDIQNLKFPDNIFEGVFCETALEHIAPSQILPTLLGFRRVLKSEGKALLGFRLGDGTIYETDDIGGVRYIQTYTMKDIKKYIRDSGFEVIKIMQSKHMGAGRPSFVNYLVINN